MGRVPNSYFDLQQAWQNKWDSCFRDFTNKAFAGVTFLYDAGYPLDKLFEAIDDEIAHGDEVLSIVHRNDLSEASSRSSARRNNYLYSMTVKNPAMRDLEGARRSLFRR